MSLDEIRDEILNVIRENGWEDEELEVGSIVSRVYRRLRFTEDKRRIRSAFHSLVSNGTIKKVRGEPGSRNSRYALRSA